MDGELASACGRTGVKVLLINYEYPPLGGGAATATRALARALRDQDVTVRVLTSQASGLPSIESTDGFCVERLWTGRQRHDRCSLWEMGMFLLAALARLPALLREEQFDGAVLYFGFPCGLLGLPLKHLFGIPYIVSLRGGDVPGTEPSLTALHRVLQPLRRRLYRSAAAVTANSEGLRQRSLEADPQPVVVIPNGVDVIPFPTAAPLGEPRILFVGRLAPQKNVDLLLRAFALLAHPQAQVIIAGDGPLRGELEASALRLGIADRVRFLGWIDRERMPQIYHQSTVMVLPSHYEGMSNVVLEAMAAGLPVIATAVEGMSELITDGRTGLTVPPGDPDALAQAIHQLLNQPSRRQALAIEARKRVQEQFTWDAAARRYLELFPHAKHAA